MALCEVGLEAVEPLLAPVYLQDAPGRLLREPADVELSTSFRDLEAVLPPDPVLCRQGRRGRPGQEPDRQQDPEGENPLRRRRGGGEDPQKTSTRPRSTSFKKFSMRRQTSRISRLSRPIWTTPSCSRTPRPGRTFSVGSTRTYWSP